MKKAKKAKISKKLRPRAPKRRIKRIGPKTSPRQVRRIKKIFEESPRVSQENFTKKLVQREKQKEKMVAKSEEKTKVRKKLRPRAPKSKNQTNWT